MKERFIISDMVIMTGPSGHGHYTPKFVREQDHTILEHVLANMELREGIHLLGGVGTEQF
jgi:hypothetical protein